MADIQALTREWQAPALPESIPQGDMPGDKICITEEHRRKAETLFPKLKQLLWETSGRWWRCAAAPGWENRRSPRCFLII